VFIGGPSGSPDLGPKDRPSPQQYVCGTDFHVRLAQAKTREPVMGNPFRALDEYIRIHEALLCRYRCFLQLDGGDILWCQQHAAAVFLGVMDMSDQQEPK